MKREMVAYTTVDIATLIVAIRGKRVILDRDLAGLYGTTTKRLNEQVKRNRNRFPEDFMFQLTTKSSRGTLLTIFTNIFAASLNQ